MNKWRRKIAWTFGLLCSKTFTYDGLMVEIAQNRLGLALEDIARVNVKGKLLFYTNDGDEHQYSLKEAHAFTRPGLPEVSGLRRRARRHLLRRARAVEGWTLTIVRTELGRDIWDAGARRRRRRVPPRVGGPQGRRADVQARRQVARAVADRGHPARVGDAGRRCPTRPEPRSAIQPRVRGADTHVRAPRGAFCSPSPTHGKSWATVAEIERARRRGGPPPRRGARGGGVRRRAVPARLRLASGGGGGPGAPRHRGRSLALVRVRELGGRPRAARDAARRASGRHPASSRRSRTRPLQSATWAESGLGRWAEAMERGESISGPVRSFPGERMGAAGGAGHPVAGRRSRCSSDGSGGD